jgi:hypothetical protein
MSGDLTVLWCRTGNGEKLTLPLSDRSALDPDIPYVPVLLEEHSVGHVTRLQAAKPVFHPEDLSRDGCGGFDGCERGQAYILYGTGDRDIQRECRAGDRVSRGQPCDAIGHINVQVADPVSPIPGASSRHGIADQGDPPGSQSAEHPNDLRPHMDTVIDNLQPSTEVLNEREYWPGRTMMHARHPIEGMGE